LQCLLLELLRYLLLLLRRLRHLGLLLLKRGARTLSLLGRLLRLTPEQLPEAASLCLQRRGGRRRRRTHELAWALHLPRHRSLTTTLAAAHELSLEGALALHLALRETRPRRTLTSALEWALSALDRTLRTLTLALGVLRTLNSAWGRLAGTLGTLGESLRTLWGALLTLRTLEALRRTLRRTLSHHLAPTLTDKRSRATILLRHNRAGRLPLSLRALLS
jgi:hypothetical protein